MELPLELKLAIEAKLEENNINELKDSSEKISLRYRNNSGKGNRLLTKKTEAISYAVARMPATYASIYTAISKTFELYNDCISSVMDVGAGTGAGSWAVINVLNVDEITCIEREDAMIEMGSWLMSQSSDNCLKNAKWIKSDLLSDCNQKADLVISSYVLNEMGSEDRAKALEKLWNCTNKVLIIVEPGTPEGSKEIREEMEWLINSGASVVAPCPNITKCPLKEPDWCNSTCRVARTKFHKMLKGGTVPYEDEKFSYIAVCKNNVSIPQIKRVLRHPQISSGRVGLKLCSKDGIEEIFVTQKDKQLFKIARKLKCGDKILY